VESPVWRDNKAEENTKNQDLVIQTKNGVLIYFPFNSTKKEVDIKVDGYLQQLTNRLQSSNEKIHIIGHTDNVGDAKANYEIGRLRAEKIRDILLQSGVSRQQISVFSKGETEPMATNGTEDGRQQNRRIEIKFFE
jgi:outer membrane protein OmpA-like peptidoglycan-associated protein